MTVLRKAATECKGAKKLFARTKDFPDPSAVAVSRWLADSHALGCWTYFRPGSSADDCSALGAPIGNGRLLGFAGEATTSADTGTLHGAMLSALREAEGVLM